MSSAADFRATRVLEHDDGFVVRAAFERVLGWALLAVACFGYARGAALGEVQVLALALGILAVMLAFRDAMARVTVRIAEGRLHYVPSVLTLRRAWSVALDDVSAPAVVADRVVLYLRDGTCLPLWFPVQSFGTWLRLAPPSDEPARLVDRLRTLRAHEGADVDIDVARA